MHEQMRLALIMLATEVTERNKQNHVQDDRKPWWINENAGTVRDNDGGLIAFIDADSLHLVQQLAQMGAA